MFRAQFLGKLTDTHRTAEKYGKSSLSIDLGFSAKISSWQDGALQDPSQCWLKGLRGLGCSENSDTLRGPAY